MVTIAGYLPASLIWNTPRLQEEPDRTREALRDLCTPLGEVSGRKALESYLTTVEPTYERLLVRLFEVVQGNQADLLDLFREAEESRARIDALIEGHRGMLGEGPAEQLSAAVGSFYGFMRWTRRTLERVASGDWGVLILAPQFTAEQTRAASWSGLCTLTIFLVLQGEVRVWKPASLKVLVAAFDDYMEVVEDAFLGAVQLPDLSDVAPMPALRNVLDLPD